MFPPRECPSKREGGCLCFILENEPGDARARLVDSSSFLSVITCFSFPQGLNCTVKNSKSPVFVFLMLPR